MPDHAQPVAHVETDIKGSGFDMEQVEQIGHVVEQTTKPSHAAMPPGMSGTILDHLGDASFVGASFQGKAGSSSGDEIVVDTEDIRATAASGRAHIAAIDELVVEMQNEMAKTEALWVGTAGDWYRDVFLTATNRFRQALEDFGSYTTELVSYADEHEGVDSRAQQIADSVEQPSA